MDNKAIMQSVRPKWCELIAAGQKTIEVRKSKPKLETPFKCYIYCTNTKTIGDFILCKSKENAKLFGYNAAKDINKGFAKKEDIQLKGKVIGEYVCYDITKYTTEFHPSDELFQGIWKQIIDEESGDEYEYGNIVTCNDFDNPDNCDICKRSCLSFEEIKNYIGYGDHEFYAWHISNLKIYDEPKELSEFYVPCYSGCAKCKYKSWDTAYGGEIKEMVCTVCNKKPLTRPPQSWCYVEEV